MDRASDSEVNPLSLQHVTLHGHDVGYRMAGSGPAVLLVHGMAGSSRTWRAVMPALAERYTVIAPDLLGHGDSDKPWGDYSLGAHASTLRDLLASVGVERVTLVGQSLGGGVAMQFAYQFPEMVERLVLVSSGGLGREVSWMLRVLTLPAAEYVMPILFPSQARELGNKVVGWINRQGWRAPHLDEIWQAYASLTSIENRRAFVRTLTAVVDPGGQSVSAKDRLYLTEDVPTLIAWGDRDPIIPAIHGVATHESIPGSRLEIFEGVGHFPHAERPDEFVAMLVDFIESTEPAVRTTTKFTQKMKSAGRRLPAS